MRLSKEEITHRRISKGVKISTNEGRNLVYKPISTEEKAYTELFAFFSQEHNLILLNSEMDDIIRAVDKFKQTYNG